MNGIFNIYKPEGPTSFNIVSSVKKLTGEKRVGHAGTLDPTASGVLPVCVGRATRVIEYLMDSVKRYRAGIEFGKTTDTYDAEGTITSESDPSGIDRTQIEKSLSSFHGEIQQVPPVYSALKYRGRPYYELARSGIEFEIESRPVTVHDISIIDWQPPVVTLDISCGKGTYIRSIANDLGQLLGCGAYMKSLVRSKYGIFTVDNSVSLEELDQAFTHDYWHRYIYPSDSVLVNMKAIVVDDENRQRIENGRPLENKYIDTKNDISENSSLTGYSGTRCRAYGVDGHFIGVLRFDAETGEWRPEKIFTR
jgi:tRNA pseudouridine55 synthase